MTVLDWPHAESDSFNAISHLVGLVLAAAGTVVLLRMAHGTGERAAFAVYGASLILLYGASTLYHSLPLPVHHLRPSHARPHRDLLPDRGDLHPGSHGHPARYLGLGAAGGGMGDRGSRDPLQDLVSRRAIWISTGMYLGMGYMALAAASPWLARVSPAGLAWLVAGGIAYTVGAIIFSRERPDPFPGYSGTTRSGICWCWSEAAVTSRSCSLARRDSMSHQSWSCRPGS